MSGQEKRCYDRVQFERQVRLDFFTEVYDNCQVMNISLGGVFVKGKMPHQVDDYCYVNLTQTGKNICLKFKAAAKVVRRDDDGVALKFTSMSFESLMSLEMILLYQEKEESGIEKELPENLPFVISE